MNKVMLVGRLTRDPELRTLPSGKSVANFVVATNEFRGGGAAERTEYHNLVAWDRLADSFFWRGGQDDLDLYLGSGNSDSLHDLSEDGRSLLCCRLGKAVTEARKAGLQVAGPLALLHAIRQLSQLYGEE
jgi:hypothetical protein